MKRRNQIVEIEFLDHTDNSDKPLRFIVYGRVAAENETSITVDSWCYANRRKLYDGNVNRHTIVKAAVLKITRLVPEE